LGGCAHANCFIGVGTGLLSNCHSCRVLECVKKEGHISICQHGRLEPDADGVVLGVEASSIKDSHEELRGFSTFLYPDHVCPLPRPVILLDGYYCGFVSIADSRRQGHECAQGRSLCCVSEVLPQIELEAMSGEDL